VLGTRARGYSDGVLQTTRRNAETVVRTAVQHVSNAARSETINGLKAVVKGVQWVSVLDSRTTLYCQGMDGKVLPIDDGPRPPAHFNCRSTVVPVVKSWKELGLDFQELPESTRASLNGQVPARITYEKWLKGQSAGFQDDVLGPSRGKMFRSGKIRVEQFTDDRGKTLTLKQLRKLENLD
jgi:SPP1 gp7 family putative phage head morphogenesis protein